MEVISTGLKLWETLVVNHISQTGPLRLREVKPPVEDSES